MVTITLGSEGKEGGITSNPPRARITRICRKLEMLWHEEPNRTFAEVIIATEPLLMGRMGEIGKHLDDEDFEWALDTLLKVEEDYGPRVASTEGEILPDLPIDLSSDGQGTDLPCPDGAEIGADQADPGPEPGRGINEG